MHRFWVDPKHIKGDHVTLMDQSFRHILKVCRFQKGQKLVLISGLGKKYIAQLEQVSSRMAEARILEEIELPPILPPYIHLVLSCPRFLTVENLIRKAVELGVSSFYPVVSDFSFVRKVASIPQSRILRWKKIAQQAMAQSMHPQGMKLHSVQSLRSVLDIYSKSNQALALFLYEGVGGQKLSSFFESFQKSNWQELWLFVGSEGGFSPQEVSIFKSYQIEPLTLGDQILKVDTACLTALGILKYKLGQL